jgi:steroid 5-alpha reductase family enzyme
MVEILVASAVAVAALMALLWLVSLARADASIVDIAWGPGFALVGAIAALVGEGAPARRWLVAGLAALWGLRLGAYLAWRNHGRGEDWRYRAMRAHHGDAFRWKSAYIVFGLQGALLWFISLPLQVAAAAREPAALGPLDLAGVALFALGFAFEAVGDWQLARFKADPGNAGRVMDRGLWRYTRHPNYFGDACVWWGLYAIAAATPGGWLTVLSPALMTFLLLRVSGVALLERGLSKRRPDYADYVRRTSAFLPLPPRRRA